MPDLRRRRWPSTLGALAAIVVAMSATPVAQGRLRPPAFVTCDRNALTSFTGRIVTVTSSTSATVLSMDTDEHTKETFTIDHADAGPSAWFFVAGRPFTAADAKVLLPDGRVRDNARATVWVCRTEHNPKVDWARP